MLVLKNWKSVANLTSVAISANNVSLLTSSQSTSDYFLKYSLYFFTKDTVSVYILQKHSVLIVLCIWYSDVKLMYVLCAEKVIASTAITTHIFHSFTTS